MGGINLGIAAGSFAQASDIKDVYQNYIKLKTQYQVRQLQQIKPGDVVGSAPPQPKLGPNGQPVIGPDGQPVMMSAQVNPRNALLAAGIKPAQINSLLGQSPAKINAALDALPNKGGPSSGVAFYKDPITGQLSATTAPIKADDTYVQAHVAQIYMSSGDPQLVAQGTQMASEVQAQKTQELQNRQLQRTQDLTAAHLLLQTNPQAGVKMLNQVWAKDFSGNSGLGTGTNFTYDPKTGTVVKQDVDMRGQPLGAATTMPINGSANGSVQGLSDYVLAATSPQAAITMMGQQHQAIYEQASLANQHIEAQASMVQAGAAQTGAAAEQERANSEAQLVPGQLAEDKAGAAHLAAETGFTNQQTLTDQIAQQNKTAVAQAINYISNPNNPAPQRMQYMSVLKANGVLPPSFEPTVPTGPNSMQSYVRDINGNILGTMDNTPGPNQGKITPTSQLAKIFHSPQGAAVGAGIVQHNGFYGVGDQYGNMAPTNSPIDATGYLYNAAVHSNAIKPVAPAGTGLLSSIFGGQQNAPGVNGTVPGAAPVAAPPMGASTPGFVASPNPRAIGAGAPAQQTYTPPIVPGGMQYGLGAAATSGNAGAPMLNGSGAMYAPQGPAGFGSNTGMGSGLAGGPPMSQIGNGQPSPMDAYTPYMAMGNQ